MVEPWLSCQEASVSYRQAAAPEPFAVALEAGGCGMCPGDGLGVGSKWAKPEEPRLGGRRKHCPPAAPTAETGLMAPALWRT